MNERRYSELIQLRSFQERYDYLQLYGEVAKETFGCNRYLNQSLYTSTEWKVLRNKIIVRDHGCDLGCEGFDIYGPIIIHHLNPITAEDILNRSPNIFDPENLISTTLATHNAIHYGDKTLLTVLPVERRKNDTCPWRHS